MAMFDSADANAVLASVLGVTAYTAVTGTHIRLGTNTPTATSNMTELSSSGYAAGGSSISWSTPSGQSASNSGAVSWTNGSGSSWSLAGVEIWDVAGTPKRHLFGAWTSEPIVIAAGNIFAVATAGVTASLL